jgi:xanthine dehydrogenase accessory factor
MVVTPDRIFDTIGGGNLEFMAIDEARAVLNGTRRLADGGQIRRYLLGVEMGQCCGGLAFVHYESFPAAAPSWVEELISLRDVGTNAIYLSRRRGKDVARAIVTAEGFSTEGHVDSQLRGAIASARTALPVWPLGRDLLWNSEDRTPTQALLDDFVLMRPVLRGDFRVVLFGAGHVGRALVPVLQPVADQIVWCDSRQEAFPSGLGGNVRCETGDPFVIIDAQPAASYYLIMTHNHSLDMVLCEAVMQRRDFAYCGLIGSASKRKRFEKHLLEEGLTHADLKHLICPIGIGGIDSKRPAAIAVSVAAELLRVEARRRAQMNATAPMLASSPVAATRAS